MREMAKQSKKLGKEQKLDVEDCSSGQSNFKAEQSTKSKSKKNRNKNKRKTFGESVKGEESQTYTGNPTKQKVPQTV